MNNKEEIKILQNQKAIVYLQKQRSQDYQNQINSHTPNYLSILGVILILIIVSPVLFPLIIFILSKAFKILSIVVYYICNLWFSIFGWTCEKLNLFDDL